MVITRVAHRYAEAIFTSIPEAELEQFFLDVRDLQASLAQSRELRNFFASPVIERSKKLEVVNALAEGRFGEWMNRVMLLLVRKERESLISEVLESLQIIRRRRLGIQPVLVTTAVPMDDVLRNEVASGLRQFANKNVDVRYAVDEDLLGGMVVRMDDTVYDGSIQRQLFRLRRRLMPA